MEKEQQLIYRKRELVNWPDGRRGLINVSESKFYEMLRTGEFPPANFRVGASRGWTADAVELWIETNRLD